MKTFPVYWVFDYVPGLLAGLGPSVPGNPLIVVVTSTTTARWPPPEPAWFGGAIPYVVEGQHIIYGGPLSDYDVPVTTSPSMLDLAQFEQDLVTSMGVRQDQRFVIFGGAPTDLPQRFGVIGEVTVPDDWNTDDLATSVLVYVFPPDGGWCMRAKLSMPQPRQRIATYAPDTGEMAFDLADSAASFAAPITAGDLTFRMEVDGVVTDRTYAFVPYTPPNPIDDIYFGLVPAHFLPADGFSLPGWTGHIYSQADFGVSDISSFSRIFPGVLPVDFEATGTHLVRWKIFDHEGRSTPWIHYLVPPVANVTGLALYPDPNNPEVGADEDVEFESASRDADGVIARYDWHFGDGQSVSVLGDDGARVTHNYALDGQYILTLIVFDNDGLSHRADFWITVVQQGQIGVLRRPDGTLLVAVVNGENVEVVSYRPADGESSRAVLKTFTGADGPSLWQTPTGDLAVSVRDKSSHTVKRYQSSDGGGTWV